MKRTTYIMIGMLVTGVAMVCGLMFYVVDRNVTQKDNFMEIGGERKTVQLPSCRVLKLTQPPVVWKQKKEGIVEAERMFSFGEVPLEVTAGDSLQQGSFSYAGDMEAFMSMTSVGDTLLVTFDFPEDKLEQHLQNDIWIRVRSEGMELRLPAGGTSGCGRCGRYGSQFLRTPLRYALFPHAIPCPAGRLPCHCACGAGAELAFQQRHSAQPLSESGRDSRLGCQYRFLPYRYGASVRQSLSSLSFAEE